MLSATDYTEREREKEKERGGGIEKDRREVIECSHVVRIGLWGVESERERDRREVITCSLVVAQKVCGGAGEGACSYS